MRKLDISVTKAQIKSFSVELDEKKPIVMATIVLITEHGKPLTEMTLSTNEYWPEGKRFDLPVSLLEPIVKIMRELERVAVIACNGNQTLIEEKND